MQNFDYNCASLTFTSRPEMADVQESFSRKTIPAMKGFNVDSQRNVPVFSQRILPDTESGLNQYLKKQ